MSGNLAVEFYFVESKEKNCEQVHQNEMGPLEIFFLWLSTQQKKFFSDSGSKEGFLLPGFIHGYAKLF